jgi:hypothetical protein
MRSLLLVESFYFRPSNQYILVRVIPSCFRFAKMCLSLCVCLLSSCSARYLTSSFWEELHTVYMGRGHVSLRVVNVTWIDLDSMAFILHFYTSLGLTVDFHRTVARYIVEDGECTS